MSTNINISVGDNKLLDQARLQQYASRQAQLEKEANQRLAREAEINRVNALAAKGLDANGDPVTGAPSTALQIDRRPAANRTNLFDYGQGYFTVARGTNDIAVVTVRSGDKNSSLTVSLAGSETPVGFRERTGVDKLPPLTPPPGTIVNQDSYFYTTVEGSDYVYDPGGGLVAYTRTQRLIAHAGVKRNDDDSLSLTTAYTESTGGWAQFFSGYTSHLTILPVGKDVAIFAYVEVRESYKTYSLHEEVLVERLYGAFPPPDETLSYSFSYAEQITEKQTNITKVAFVVSKNSVRQITYPEALYTKLLSSRRYTAFSVLSESLEVPTGSYYIFFPSPTGLTAYGTWFSVDTEPTPLNLDYTQNLMAYWGEAVDYYIENRSSPGEYSALQDAITPVAPTARYSEIAALLPAIGQTFQWYRVNENLSPYQLQRYKGDLPEYYGDPFDEAAFVRIKSIVYTEQPGESYYRWTDWLAPSYCRQEALALGFTSADLTR